MAAAASIGIRDFANDIPATDTGNFTEPGVRPPIGSSIARERWYNI